MSSKFDGYIKVVRNPESRLSEVEGAAFQRMREKRLEQIAKEHSRLRDEQDVAKKLRAGTTEILTEAFPNYGSLRKRILDTVKPELEKARANIAALIWDNLDLDVSEDLGNVRPEHITPTAPTANARYW